MAVLSESALLAKNATDFPDNNTKFITPTKHRGMNADLINTMFSLGNPQRLLVPQLLFPGKSWISEYPVDASGISTPDPNSYSLSGQDDWSLELMHCYIEAAKDTSKAIALVGGYRCAGPFYIPMASGTLFGVGRNQAVVIYDGATDGDFLLGGDVVAPEIAMPVTNVSVSGGRTTLTIGVPNAGLRAKFRRASSAQSGGAWTNLLAVTDPWGAWLSEFANTTNASANMRDNGSNFSRNVIYSFNAAARTVTLTGTVGWTPTWFTVPALNASTQAYNGIDSHPRHRWESVHDIQFFGRDKGVMRVQYTRGVKGRGDPLTRYDTLLINGMKECYFDADSDSNMDDITVVSSPGNGPTFTSVDSQWADIQVASSVKLGVIFDSNFGQSWIERLKAYYLSTLAPTFEDAGSFVFRTNLAGLHVTGPIIAEDTAGPVFRIENNVRNVTIDVCEVNNCGAVGAGAPGLAGRPFWPCDVHFLKQNVSLLGWKNSGLIRANMGNRGGSHVRRLLYVSAADTNAWGTTGGRYMIRDVLIDFDMVIYTQSEDTLDKWAGDLAATWNSGTSYANGSVARRAADVAGTGTLSYVYQSKVAGITSGGQPPESNTAQWNYIGFGRDVPCSAWSSGTAYATQGTFVRRDAPAHLRCDGAGALAYQAKVASPTVGVDPLLNPDHWRISLNGGRQAWIEAFRDEGEVLSNTRPKEYKNVQIKLNGRRDPSYHRRTLPGWSSFTADHQHDFVTIDMTGTSAQSVIDCFPGEDGKRQVWTAKETGKAAGAALSNAVKLEMGSRSRGAPWQAGSVAYVARAGKEMETEWRGEKLHWVEHVQHEVIPTANTAIAVDIGDWGHTLEVSETMTITLPAAADVPAGWYFDTILMGSGKTVTYSGTATNKTTLTTQYQVRRVQKVGSALLMRTI